MPFVNIPNDGQVYDWIAPALLPVKLDSAPNRHLFAFHLHAEDNDGPPPPRLVRREDLKHDISTPFTALHLTDPPPEVTEQLYGLALWKHVEGLDGSYVPNFKCYHIKRFAGYWSYADPFGAPCDIQVPTFGPTTYHDEYWDTYIPNVLFESHPYSPSFGGGFCPTPLDDFDVGTPGWPYGFLWNTCRVEVLGYADVCNDTLNEELPVPIVLPARIEINEDIPPPPTILCECLDGAEGPPGPQGPPGEGSDVLLTEFDLKHPQFNEETKEWEEKSTKVYLPANEDHHMGTAFGIIYDLLARLIATSPAAAQSIVASGEIDYVDKDSRLA